MLPWGTCDSKVRRSLSRTKASVEVAMQASGRQVACGWDAACKGKGGEGRLSAPGMVQGSGARGRGTVVVSA